MTLFSALPEPPTAPAYLRWDLADSIRHDDGETLCVSADVWQTAEGWCWSAACHGYHVDPEGAWAIRGVKKAGPSMGWLSEAEAKAAAETWIRERVAALGVGPDECEHGIAGSLDCRACDLAVVMGGGR